MVKIRVDKNEIEAQEGTKLLQACLDHGIYIPNLCFLAYLEHPPASCRLCFVEIEGMEKPVPSCTIEVREGMAVRTDSPSVRGLQKSAFRLFMSVHHVDCSHCQGNRRCELQRIAKFLRIGLKPGKLEKYLKEPAIIRDHPLIDYYPNRCVLCGKCFHTCFARQGRPMLDFAKRGFNTVISFYGTSSSGSACETCLACVQVCPVSALTLKRQGS
ncbi:MAG: nuoG2 [Deltaproteobacteria bacterium]|nr:nuoG2 [Deltaproteobacteria bacterium]